MANYSIRLDLLKVKGAFLTKIKGRTATKDCLVIPVDGSGLFVGEKGVYLSLTASEMREPKYDETHSIRVSLDRAAYDALTDEERKAIPYVGGMREFQTQVRSMRVEQTIDMSAPSPADDPNDDLPF